MINLRWIQWPAQWPVHYIVAFRTILPAHVLDDANVSAFNDDFERVVIPVENRPEMRTAGVTREFGRVVRRPRQQDRGMFALGCGFRNDDHGMQLHAIAHRNHYVTTGVFEA